MPSAFHELSKSLPTGLQMVELATEKQSPQALSRGEKTRLRLLDATLTLIARRGVGSFTVREVVQQASSSLGVLTYHFPTRRELLAAAFARHLAKQDAEALLDSPLSLAQVAPSAEPGGAVTPDLDAMTIQGVALLSRMVHDDRDVFLAGHELDLEVLRDAELAAKIGPARKAHPQAINDMLRAAGSSEPNLDADLLAATFEGLGMKWLSHPDDDAFDAHLHRAVRRLLEKFFTAAD